MAFSINNAQLNLALEVARASRITLYGLHYHISWDKLINKSNIIKALIINQTQNIFTTDEEQCLQDELTNPSSACITCQ
jgi:hypothetical protein